jgi:hypothetical protein
MRYHSFNQTASLDRSLEFGDLVVKDVHQSRDTATIGKSRAVSREPNAIISLKDSVRTNVGVDDAVASK